MRTAAAATSGSRAGDGDLHEGSCPDCAPLAGGGEGRRRARGRAFLPSCLPAFLPSCLPAFLPDLPYRLPAFPPSLPDLSEIELRADLEEPRLQHVGRPQPRPRRRRRERVVHRERPVAVEHVVEVEVEAEAVPGRTGTASTPADRAGSGSDRRTRALRESAESVFDADPGFSARPSVDPTVPVGANCALATDQLARIAGPRRRSGRRG